jgi:4-hydroxyphenylpyruvate dioxygenase
LILPRIGCDLTPEGEKKEQAAGCGGFGKGNFGELFKSIENFEKQQEEAAKAASKGRTPV